MRPPLPKSPIAVAKTETELLSMFAVSASGLPSLFTSTTLKDTGPLPTGQLTAGANIAGLLIETILEP